MTHGNDVGCPFRPHDPGNLRHGKHVTLLNLAGTDPLKRRGQHVHGSLGDRGSIRLILLADVNHAGPAIRIEVGQIILDHLYQLLLGGNEEHPVLRLLKARMWVTRSTSIKQDLYLSVPALPLSRDRAALRANTSRNKSVLPRFKGYTDWQTGLFDSVGTNVGAVIAGSGTRVKPLIWCRYWQSREHFFLFFSIVVHSRELK
jgi:hypothetical protein